MSDAIDEGEELAERQVLLRQKLEGNLQRNTRRAFLASLPDSLHLYLADRQFLPMSEFAGVSPRFRITPEGFGMPSVISDSYRFCEFAWRHKVLEETQGIDARHDAEPAFFWPLDNNPIYQVEFGWVRMNLNGLLDYRLGVITADGSAGLVVDEYCGHVPGDYNPDEVVYELAVWGFGSNREPTCSIK